MARSRRSWASVFGAGRSRVTPTPARLPRLLSWAHDRLTARADAGAAPRYARVPIRAVTARVASSPSIAPPAVFAIAASSCADVDVTLELATPVAGRRGISRSRSSCLLKIAG